jgi:hypothetical protein
MFAETAGFKKSIGVNGVRAMSWSRIAMEKGNGVGALGALGQTLGQTPGQTHTIDSAEEPPVLRTEQNPISCLARRGADRSDAV